MIDNFSLALSHGLIMLAVWRLFFRPELDNDDASPTAPAGSKRTIQQADLKGREHA